MTVPDWWLKFEYFRLFYVPSPPVFTCCNGLDMSGGTDRECMLAIEKNKNFVICFSSVFRACKYGHGEHSFRYKHFNAHEGGFIVRFPALLIRTSQID